MRRLGYAVNFGLYLALAVSVGLLLKWIGETKHGIWSKLNVTVVLVVTTIVITVLVFFILDVCFRGNHRLITTSLSWVNGNRWSWLLFVLLPLNGLFMGFMLKGPWKAESWGVSTFVMFQAAFLAMYATKGVSSDVSKALAAQQLGYVATHLTKVKHWPNDYVPAIACGLSTVVCLIVMFFRLAGLKYDGAIPGDEVAGVPVSRAEVAVPEAGELRSEEPVDDPAPEVLPTSV